MSWEQAVAWRSSTPGRLVFTNGVFDLLHRGHIDLLAAARACGDALVVGINSDASVRRLKGPGRPVRSAADRAYVLAAVCGVDAAVVFDQDTPLELVLALRPDVPCRHAVACCHDMILSAGRLVLRAPPPATV